MFKKLLFFISIVLLISSCNEYQKLLKSNDYNAKYEKGVWYYEKGDYTRAFNLLESLDGIFRGTAKAEKVDYYLAGSYYGKEEYISAGYRYGMFARTYPKSPNAEEALYKSAYCAYLNASPVTLDLEFTKAGIDALQFFINKYPNSKYVEECNHLVDDLRQRLEEKAFLNAKLYYDLEEYKAACIALKNVLKEYPDAKKREEILYLIVKSSYLLAEKSVLSKQVERYRKTIDEYFVFVDEYPSSDKTKEVQKIYRKSKKFLNK